MFGETHFVKGSIREQYKQFKSIAKYMKVRVICKIALTTRDQFFFRPE